MLNFVALKPEVRGPVPVPGIFLISLFVVLLLLLLNNLSTCNEHRLCSAGEQLHLLEQMNFSQYLWSCY